MAQLKCENLSIGYGGKTIAQDINFSAEAGNYICIVGENGSGKSTLVKCLLNLTAPLSGQITLGDGMMPSDIGYLPQQTEIQKDFPASVNEVIMSAFSGKHKFLPFFKKSERKKAECEMTRLGISDLRNRCYRELSGGQQQRVFLARALCAASKMIVLDEPVNGLDPHVTSQMYDIINKINHEDKITVIMVSHDVRAAIKYSSHILHIGHDSTFFGTRNEYIKSEIGQRFLL